MIDVLALHKWYSRLPENSSFRKEPPGNSDERVEAQTPASELIIHAIIAHMTFDPSILSNSLLFLTAWGAAFIAALWLSLIIWTYRDIKARGKDPLIRFLAVLVVAVLFLPGIVIYLILRPSQTLEDEYQQTLEEEALLRSIEETALCPGCSRRVKDDWVICPHCHTKQRKPCHHCSYLMDLSWNLCPHCGTPAPGMRRETQTLDEALEPLAIGHLHEEGKRQAGEQEDAEFNEDYPPLKGNDIFPDLDFEPVEED